MRKKKVGWVYLIESFGPVPYQKIGVSTNPDRRIWVEIAPKLPFEVELTHLVVADDIYGAEAELHQRFKNKRANGEWFQLSSLDLRKINGWHVYENGYFVSLAQRWLWDAHTPYNGQMIAIPRLWLPSIPNVNLAKWQLGPDGTRQDWTCLDLRNLLREQSAFTCAFIDGYYPNCPKGG